MTSDDRVRLTIYANEYVKEATPEPQQADASPVLDLVRQYGDERQRMGSATFAASAPVVHEYKTRAAATLARIAALVPQQPVQARSGLGFPWWHHGCGEVAKGGVPPRLHGCDTPGPWRPLLVDGYPAPERDCHEPHTDGPREPSAQERADHDLMAALGVEQLDEVIPAIEHLKALVDHLRNWRSEHDERERECDKVIAQLNQMQENAETWQRAAERLKAAQPDPLKLHLPKVPLGTAALTGVDGDRYRWLDDGSDQWEAIEPRPGWRGQLGALLDREGTPVTVEPASPRESRTAAEIWTEMRSAGDDRLSSALAEALDREAGL